MELDEGEYKRIIREERRHEWHGYICTVSVPSTHVVLNHEEPLQYNGDISTTESGDYVDATTSGFRFSTIGLQYTIANVA